METYIEEKADSALAVLQNITPNRLRGKEEKACYALLLSMAMDKNFIDKTSFEVLQPAIDYYEHHGTATDKLRTLYYKGRIYTNQGDNVSAILCFDKALNEGKESEDILTKGRVRFMQANIYKSLYRWDDFIEKNKQAAELFKRSKLQNSYANCLIRIANGYILKKDKENAEKFIRLCESVLDSMSVKRQGEFYVTYLLFLTEYGTKEDLKLILEKYQAAIPEKDWDWVTIAKAYFMLDDCQAALNYIQKYQFSPNVNQNIRYYALAYKIYEKSGCPEKALTAYVVYSNITDSINLTKYGLSTQFIEECHKYELQIKEEHEKSGRIIFLSIIVILVLLLICIWIRIRLVINAAQKKKLELENENYRLHCLQIEEERDNLTELLRENKDLSITTQDILSERVSLLNKFLLTCIRHYGVPNNTLNKEVEKLLADRDAFMNSNRLSFKGSHPAFIQYLEEKGLNEWEINYCCLYALGLNGKEIGTYIKMRSHYNQSSIIREKLGINEHDTNLGLYLRKLLNGFRP